MPHTVTLKGNSDFFIHPGNKRASLDRKNIQKQIDKAPEIVSGQAIANKAQFLALKARTTQLNQTLIDKAYASAGIKGWVTHLDILNQPVIEHYPSDNKQNKTAFIHYLAQ